MNDAAALELKAPKTAAEKQKPAVAWGYKHNGYFALKVLLTLSGFIIAIIVNIAFPQKAAVEFKTYTLSLFGLNIDLTINDAYIFVIAVLMLIYGGADAVVPPKINCEAFAERLKAAGGKISVIRRAAFGHHPHGLDPDKTQPIIDFFRKADGD